MTYAFAFAALGAVFDPVLHGREDLKVLQFDLSQEESALAQLTCSLCLGGQETWDDQKLFVSYGHLGAGDLLFTGVAVDAPPAGTTGARTVTFVAYHPQAQGDLETLAQTYPVDDLFHVPGNDGVAEALDAQPAVLHWDRHTGRVGLSDLLHGRQTLDLTGKVWAKSLSITRGLRTVDAVRLRLQAQWTQRATGFMDVGPAIDQAFGGKFNSFNAFSLGVGWPRAGTLLNQSGYYVYDSRLDPLVPPAAYPTRSAFVPAGGKAKGTGLLWNGDKTQVAFPRHWYRATLGVLWSFHQPRREAITLSVASKQVGSPLPRRTQELTLNLQPLITPGVPIPWRPGVLYKKDVRVFHGGIVYKALADHVSDTTFGGALWKDKGKLSCALEDPSSATFFLTPRGRAAVAHGLRIAQRLLIQASRTTTVTLETDWQWASGVTLDHGVFLKDPRLPGGQITGKVVAYRLSARGKTGDRRVWIKVAAGEGETRETVLSLPDYGDQKPKEGLVDVASLGPQDLIERVDIQGHPEDQRALLDDPTVFLGDKGRALNGALATGIHIHFRDLHTPDTLVHEIEGGTIQI